MPAAFLEGALQLAETAKSLESFAGRGTVSKAALGAKTHFDKVERKRNRYHQAHIFPSRSFGTGLLFMNEFLQSLLSNVLTRKRVWRLLMEKSFSLLGL